MMVLGSIRLPYLEIHFACRQRRQLKTQQLYILFINNFFATKILNLSPVDGLFRPFLTLFADPDIDFFADLESEETEAL